MPRYDGWNKDMSAFVFPERQLLKLSCVHIRRNRIRFLTCLIMVYIAFFKLAFAADNTQVEPDLSLSSASISLERAITLAHEFDPWLEGSKYRQQSLTALSEGATALPDPKLTFSLVNLPSESLSFHREAMTQVKVGVSQMIPRGELLALRKQQFQDLGNQHPWQRLDRKHQLTVKVTQIWLAAFQAQHSISLIEQDRELFQHLADVAQSHYANALGKTRQHDVVRAQLEITRLEDRLTLLDEQMVTNQSALLEWVAAPPLHKGLYPPTSNTSKHSSIHSSIQRWTEQNISLALGNALPRVELIEPEVSEATWGNESWLSALQEHPALKAIDMKITAGKTGIDVANQNYAPQWSLNASYSYRATDPLGNDRADFLSLGLGVEMPLFSSRRQDSGVKAAIAANEAVKTEKRLILRSLLAGAKTSVARLQRLNRRQAIYETQLLNAMSEQAEASLTAYTNDEGDFAEVVRARIAELNTRIEAFVIQIQRLQTIAQINYYLAGTVDTQVQIEGTKQ